MTNHDFFRRETLVSDACIPGIEISTTEGHLLVIGPNPPERTYSGTLSPEEAVELAHRHDCVAIVAHPFRNSRLRESDADFDAIEINGKHPEHRKRIQRIASDRDLPIVGGSDAHFPFEVGRLSTRLDIDQFTPEAVVDAIRDGRVEPVVRDGRLTRALRLVYSNIHRLRGHL
ncbi:PHP domain-containing protein [Halorubrum sp. HHNYT27]|uniref:PHP domain-containing protein n=1 Tax=Halorubrum sp. HHNYT27 TaxID=3402275 RepID=UPI003EB9CD51